MASRASVPIVRLKERSSSAASDAYEATSNRAFGEMKLVAWGDAHSSPHVGAAAAMMKARTSGRSPSADSRFPPPSAGSGWPASSGGKGNASMSRPITASAGANVLATYVVGKRADAYFSLGPGAMQDPSEIVRAVSGVDERNLINWTAEGARSTGNAIRNGAVATGRGAVVVGSAMAGRLPRRRRGS